MELLQLRIFSIAAKHNSFSKAASAMFISLPSVSKYIAALESEIHKQLFIRDGRKVYLTDFGKSFLLYTDEILEKEDAALRFLASNKSDSDIRYIGIVSHMESAPPDFYMDLLHAKQKFEQSYPMLEVKIRFHDIEDLRSNLTSGDIDMALFSIPNTDIPNTLLPGMRYKKLNHFRYYLAVPSKMAKGDTLEEVAHYIKTLAYVNTPAPKQLAWKFMADYHVAPQLIPMGHWGNALTRMVSNECATVISENLCEMASLCGAKVFDLPDERYSNGLYTLWWSKNIKLHLPELAECLAQCTTKPARYDPM